MQYRGHGFQYVDDMSLEAEAVQEQSSNKAYRRHKRPYRSSRRHSPRATGNHPGYGIAGRRNHRWAW